MSQVTPKEPEKPPEFAIKGVNGRIITQPLDKLWAENPVKKDRY
jgi:hypothetical protein